MSSVQQPADPRAALEARLGGLYQLLVRFEGLQHQERAIYQRHMHKYLSYKHKWGAGMYWLWVLILTMTAFVATFSIVTAMFVAQDLNSGSGVSASASSEVQSWAPVLFLLPLPVALVASGVIVGIRNARVPKVNAKRLHVNQERSYQIAEFVAPEIVPIVEQIRAVSREFNTHFKGFFPVEYCTTEDVGTCWRLVHDHRASTVVEARREHETLLHRQRLEDGASAQLAATQRAAKVAALGNVITAAGFGATIGTLRASRGRR